MDQVKFLGNHLEVKCPKAKRPGAIVLIGPSGAGKSTIIKEIMRRQPNRFEFVVSHTTRDPRGSEQNGIDYVFRQKESMMDDVLAGKFLEHATFGEHLYGTPRTAVEKILSRNKIAILDLESAGVAALQKLDYGAAYCGVLPPDFYKKEGVEELKRRLSNRGETPEMIEKRIILGMPHLDPVRTYISRDSNHPSYINCAKVDATIVNAVIEKAADDLLKFAEVFTRYDPSRDRDEEDATPEVMAARLKTEALQAKVEKALADLKGSFSYGMLKTEEDREYAVTMAKANAAVEFDGEWAIKSLERDIAENNAAAAARGASEEAKNRIRRTGDITLSELKRATHDRRAANLRWTEIKSIANGEVELAMCDWDEIERLAKCRKLNLI